MDETQFQLGTVVSAPFQENTFVLWKNGQSDCLVVDPGFDTEETFAFLRNNSLTPAAILITHGHSDHIAGNGALKARWPECLLVAGHAEAAKLIDPQLNLSAAFGKGLVSPPADKTVRDGETFSAAGFDLEVREIPGHSIGHVVFVWKGSQPHLVFVGDVIFSGSVGRTDFYDGDFDQLAEGIRGKLFSLPDDTVLLPGHGPATTVGREKRTNPFVREK